MKDDFTAFVGCWSAAILIAVGIVFILGIKCENQSISFEAHKYKIIGGCMVKHEGKWLPLENIRGFD